MDFLKFVNSKDIREYLKKIGYVPSPLECAWLVYHNNTATLEERIIAWQYIIDNMPDSKLPNISEEKPYSTLHSFLKKYIEIKQEHLTAFISTHTGDFIYYYEVELLHDEIKSELFFTFEECKNAVFDDYSSENISDIKIVKIRVSDKNHKRHWVYLSPAGTITDVCGPLTETVWQLISTFKNLKVRIPLPFKCGDVLYDPTSELPFVLEKIQENDEGTYADIICLDYLSSMLYKDRFYHYMNFEYCHEELCGHNKLLKLVSEYYKDRPADILNYLNRYLITYIDGELERHTAEHCLVKKEINLNTQSNAS